MNTSLNPDQIILTLQKLLEARREPPGAITLHAPLLGVEPARLALRCGEAKLMRLIQNGSIEWAFDLRREGAKRAHLLILTECVVRLQQRSREMKPQEPARRETPPFGPIFDGLFRHNRAHLLTTELARVWNCSSSHVHNLVADGLLATVKKNYLPREAWLIRRDSACRFMESRRVR